MNVIYVNGKYVDAKRAKVPALDRGILYGQGVFETLRTKKGRALFFKDHFERLKKGAAFVGMRFGMTQGGLKRIIKKVTEINKYEDAYVRVTLTGGDNGLRGTLIKSMFPDSQTLIVYAHGYNPPPESYYKNGVRLFLSNLRRSRGSVAQSRPGAGYGKAVPPRGGTIAVHHKTTNYVENMLAKRKAAARDCFDALFLDTDGFISECATSNVFWIKRGALCTPSLECPILPGITRKNVIRLAKKAGIKVRELDWPRYRDLLRADEVFVTNSLAGVLPVKKIGKITSLIRNLYEKEIK